MRPLEADDDAFILELVNDADFIRHIGDREVRNRADARRYIEKCRATCDADGHGLYRVSLEPGGDRAGICGLLRRPYLPDPDIGFAFLPGFHGRGYAFESASAVIAHALGPLGMTRILAIVSPANTASIGLLGKIGLVYVRTILPPGERTTVNLYSSDGTAPEPVSVRGSGAA